MPRYTSRVKNTLKPTQNSKPREMADKIVKTKKIGVVAKALAPKVTAVVKKVIPIIKNRLGAALPVGGRLPTSPDVLSGETIDKLAPHVFIHMLSNMDMPTFHMLQGIAANYLKMEHPLNKIIGASLGGDFVMPKTLSKIAMRDVLKAKTPQELSSALHSEWLDMMDGKLTPTEVGGGLFSSLKVLVKKGIAGGKKALSALATGAAAAVRAVSAGAMGAQMVGKSVNNALMQGIEVANSLSPIIQSVFPKTEGVLTAGLGHANAAKELLERGINIAGQVEQAVAPVVSQLGPIDAPIALPFTQPVTAAVEPVEPVGAGLDSSVADISGSDVSGPRFVS